MITAKILSFFFFTKRSQRKIKASSHFKALYLLSTCRSIAKDPPCILLWRDALVFNKKHAYFQRKTTNCKNKSNRKLNCEQLGNNNLSLESIFFN